MKDVYSVLTNTNQRELFKKDHVAFFAITTKSFVEFLIPITVIGPSPQCFDTVLSGTSIVQISGTQETVVYASMVIRNMC